MKEKILSFILTFCMVIGFMPYTASAGTVRTVTVYAVVGGKVSTDGKTWSDQVNTIINVGEKIGNSIVYQADDGYELDNITSHINIVSVAAGASHTVILDDEGQVYTSGNNGFGQRAIGDPNSLTSSQYSTWYFSKPTNGIDGIKFKAVAAGKNHTVLLSEDGDVYTAGWNNYGQLGRAVSNTKTTLYDNTFAKVTVGDGTVKIVAIAASAEHTVLVDENGKVWTAGYNYIGQLGRTLSGKSEYEAAFGQVDGDVNNVTIVDAAAGSDQTVLLDNDGQVWTVGQSFYGANGQGGKRLKQFAKCSIDGNPKITSIAAGELFTVLLDENGSVYTTGYNKFGQLGLENNTERNTFAKVTSGVVSNTKITSIAAGKDYTILTDENGKVYAAGNNKYGQLGLPLSTESSNVFTAVNINGIGESKIISTATRESHTILLDDTGKIWSAGRNNNFQICRLLKPYKENVPDFELAMSSPVLQTEITNLADFTVTGNHTITVNFKEREKISVAYRLNFGSWVSGFTPPAFYYKGDSFTPPELTNLVREGYNAKDWSILSQTDTAVTYSVSWEEKSNYTVKYNTNGGTQISDKTNVKWNDEVLDEIKDPKKEGWEFNGWTFKGTEVYNDEWGSPCYSELVDSDSIMEITLDANWLDITAPIITGLTDGKTYCSATEFNATDNDDIASVTVNGMTVHAENGKYTLLPAQGEQTVLVKDNAGNSSEVTVTVNDGHTYEWQSENGQYWQKCKFCDYETDKKDIPKFVITGADRVCKTQDYKFNFVLPQGAVNAKCEYEFNGTSGTIDNLTCINGTWSGVLSSSQYDTKESNFKITVYAKTDDGFEINASKTVTLLATHTGGKATCNSKAKCEVCGESYGNLDADNHIGGTELRDQKTATCTEKGYTGNTYCLGCNKVLTKGDEIKPNGHKGGKATCNSKAKCEICGESYGEIDKDNHSDLKHFAAKSATKKSKGNIEYWYCKGCNKYFSNKKATKEISKSDTVIEKLKDTNRNTQNDTQKSPQTGDNGNILLLVVVMLISGVVIMNYLVVNKKNKQQR